MQLSKYEVYKDAFERLNSLSREEGWNTLNLDPHAWKEIKCWFSHLNVDTEEQVLKALEQLADSTWDNSPSGVESIPTIEDEETRHPESAWLAGLPREHKGHLPPSLGGVHGP